MSSSKYDNLLPDYGASTQHLPEGEAGEDQVQHEHVDSLCRAADYRLPSVKCLVLEPSLTPK